MRGIKISKAKKKDSSYIQEKVKKYLLDGTNLDWRQFFAARLKDKIVAFGRLIDHGDFFEVASIGVDYEHRKKGIGKKVFAFLVQQAKERDSQKPIYGVTHLELFVAGCGFKLVKDNYPDYLDYKRKHICRLDEFRISVMKWSP